MRRLFGLAALYAFVCTGVSLAQSPGDQAVRAAMVLTPPGALAPLATTTIEGEVQNGVMFALRYGYVPAMTGGTATNNVAATANLPLVFNSTISLTGGLFAPSCTGCNAGGMFSLGGDIRVWEIPFDVFDGSRLTFTVNGESGFAHPSSQFGSGSAWGSMIGLPIGWVSGDRTRDKMRIVPFFTPSLAFGSIETAGATLILPPQAYQPLPSQVSGTRFVIGGGLALFNRASTFGFSFGFQYISVPNSEMQVGAAMTFGGR